MKSNVNTDRIVKPELIVPGMGVPPAVALVNPKYAHNAATVLRNCAAYGMNQLWITGDRVIEEWSRQGRLHREERMRAYKKVSVFHGDYFFDAFENAVPVAVEIRESAENLAYFEHPDNALYVFGPEDGSLGKQYLRHCHHVIVLPTDEDMCVNLGVAVGNVLLHRRIQRQLAGKDPIRPPITSAENKRGWANADDELNWDGAELITSP